jgi:hypothetical protein
MAITLPASPAPRSMTPRLISKRRDLEPTFGGPTTRVQRLGSRWSIDFELPPMRYSDAMAWAAALTKGEGDTVLLKVPQPGFDTGAPGTPLVNGAGQLGSLIDLDGFGTYTAKAGQFFSIIISGRRYLYQVAADQAAAAGVMTDLPISPMIRRSPANNAVVEMATPYIEGFLSGRETSWTVDVARTVGLAFTITERE